MVRDNLSNYYVGIPTGRGGSDRSVSEEGPQAYLNWAVFDRDWMMIESQSGYMHLSAVPLEDGSNVDHERLAIPEDLVITQAGYVYIWLSNEEQVPVEVYFDDFRVEHIKSPVIQSDDYYPFGLTFNSYSRENSLANQYKFQGQEHQDELDLGWVSFKWRNHQPDIGRFFNVDPLGENFYHNSPYAFAENRVINGVELEGLEWENFMSKFKKPSELAVKPVPSGKGVQEQSYNVVVQNPKKALNDLRATFKDKPQKVLSNSKADFQPVDGDGKPFEHANLQEGSYIDIAIDGPMNNSYVNVMDEQNSEDGFSYTFQTLEGHIEAGKITFSASQDKDGNIIFSINSTSKVDMGLAPEGCSRRKQKESWLEVLDNVVKYLGG